MPSAAALILSYRCAQCWGALVERYKGGAYVVECGKSTPCQPGGFVTTKYVDEARAQAAADAVEVALSYPELAGGALPSPVEAARMKRSLWGEEVEHAD